MLTRIQSGGFFSNLLGGISSDMTCHFPLPNAPLTLQGLLDTLAQGEVDFLLCPPHLLDQAVRDEDHLKLLTSHVRMIAYGGSKFGDRTGDILVRHLTIFSMYATGECGVVAKMLPDNLEDASKWKYVIANPRSGLEMRPLSGMENAYEAVIVRNSDPEWVQPIFKLKPDLQEWSARDVFIGNQASDSQLMYFEYGYRLDDLVQLYGEDVHVPYKSIFPVKFEHALSGTDTIRAALVYGMRRPFAILLLELEGQDVGDNTLSDKVWAEIQKYQHHLGIEIAREHVVLADASRPLPRAAKGSVQRALAAELYRKEMNDVC